jgi:hypothetical protein
MKIEYEAPEIEDYGSITEHTFHNGDKGFFFFTSKNNECKDGGTEGS